MSGQQLLAASPQLGSGGLVVFIIGFLSASGPGALSKSGSRSCREGGRGCPGVEAGGLWGAQDVRETGKEAWGAGNGRALSFGWFLVPYTCSFLFPLSPPRKHLASRPLEEGLWVLRVWQVRTEELPGVAQCGPVPAHGPSRHSHRGLLS